VETALVATAVADSEDSRKEHAAVASPPSISAGADRKRIANQRKGLRHEYPCE
jgi:hypothetical protein